VTDREKPFVHGCLTVVTPEEIRTGIEKFPKRVLVVDDEPLIRWAASSTLAAAGFVVVEASDVAGARQVAGANALELALLDFRLPDGDGVALMHEIHAAQPGCRFIMMTAFRTPQLTANAAGEHVAILDKPFDMPELVALVGRTMASETYGTRHNPHR
jgi:two-component system response regulator PilR (NtrC family)